MRLRVALSYHDALTGLITNLCGDVDSLRRMPDICTKLKGDVMKRDLMLIYRLLEKLEHSDFDFTNAPIGLAVSGHSRAEVAYHLLLLRDAGFVETTKNQRGQIAATRLTWAGHDYLETSNDIVIDGIDDVFADFGEA